MFEVAPSLHPALDLALRQRPANGCSSRLNAVEVTFGGGLGEDESCPTMRVESASRGMESLPPWPHVGRDSSGRDEPFARPLDRQGGTLETGAVVGLADTRGEAVGAE